MQRLVASFFSLLVLIVVSVLFVHVPGTHVAYAQSIDSSGDTQPLTISTDPAYPVPYQAITITPDSSSFDIAGATISVSVNGVSVYTGSGGQAVPVTVGGPGTATSISVTAIDAGQTYSQKLIIRPATVALLVEPVTTTHPFYAGRSLISAQSEVRLVAIPDIRTSALAAVPVSQLVYTWKFGDQILESDSGIGKNVLNAVAPEQYRDANVTVTVSTQDGTINAQASTNVSSVTPIVRIYRNDALMGPFFDTALTGDVTMNDSEDTYRAVPYYFGAAPSLTWTVNGTESGGDQDITVRSSGSGQGTAVLGVTARQSTPFATAASTISVLFGQKASANIFGL